MKKRKISKSFKDKQRDLIEIVLLNPNLKKILTSLDFPDDHSWFLVAGCINQTVWNYLTGREITYGIGDYDLVYWSSDISDEQQEKYREVINKKYQSLDIELDIHNEARIHTRYPSLFGIKIDQFESAEAAIYSFPTKISCVGVSGGLGKDIFVYAPFDLNDIFEMKLRYNPETPIPDRYIFHKLKKWQSKWPEIKIVKKSYPKSVFREQ